MKFDKLVNSLLSEATKTKGYSLYWKDEEHKKTSKWYTASTPENLLQQVNRDNLTGDFEYGMVDEDHEFKSFQELLNFCSHSDFFITGPDGKIISGMYMKDEDAEENEETLNGIIKFKPYGGGSKSESIRPFLYHKTHESEKPINLLHINDDPFNNRTLRPFNNQHVVVKGYREGDTFIVTHIDTMYHMK